MAMVQKKSWAAILAGSMLTAAMLTGCGAAAKDEGSSSLAAVEKADSAPAKREAPAGGGASSGSSQTSLSNQAAPAERTTVGGGPAPAATGGSGTGTGIAAEAPAGRQIIYKANVTMEVADFASANTDINNRIHLAGGYLLQFSENQTDYEKSATLVVKVPAGGFNRFLAELESAEHKSIQRSVQGQDVSEEFVDLDARLKSKQAEEARLLDFMGKATKSDELVAFSAQIGKVQTEIEQLKGRMRYLEQNVAYSTVEIRLYQKIAKAGLSGNQDQTPFAAKLSKALTGSSNVLIVILQGLLIVLAAALPVLVVAAIIGVPLYILYRKRRANSMRQQERARQIRLQNSAAAGEESDAERKQNGAE
ncbi:DUF4349 domain-containing protein [Paenibacillus ginsengarvi]|uniref:DUF4349 domain-containing protein n=1 Tax=Paenibacillus ginsengarvi TaxID=400777 RepID=A0A3B0CWP6_9BACL|nr:DUF4349 domain-containing protein [Paenibacillus ginsengarvi]RKN86899.1 DUF4349 domain-containing protein [Paenibacillus ginsengarvi]